jgi:hypothetical protein
MRTNEVTIWPLPRKVLIYLCLLGLDILKCRPPWLGALLLLYPTSGTADPVIDAGYIVLAARR